MILLLHFSFRKILRFDRPIFVPEASLRLELMSRQRLVGRRVRSGRGGSYITLFVPSILCYSIHRIQPYVNIMLEGRRFGVQEYLITGRECLPDHSHVREISYSFEDWYEHDLIVLDMILCDRCCGEAG